MKTLEKLADSYIKENYATINNIEGNIAKCGFKAGFNAAQIWTPIKEELPEYGDIVLLKFDNKDHMVCTGYYDKNNFIPDYNLCEVLKVTHWRPIYYK